MLVLNLPFKALMFLTLMRPSLVLFLVLWLKLVKDFLKVRCRLALLPFLISCLIWLDLVASLPLIKERILVIIVLLLMLPLLVWLTPDLRIKKSLLKCNWTIRKRLPRCKMRLKKRLLAFSRRLHARIRKTRYMHKMLTQAQTAGQYFTNDQIKEMTRKVSAEVDLVHQQTQNQRYGSSHIGATAKDISNVVTDAASGVVDIFHGIGSNLSRK